MLSLDDARFLIRNHLDTISNSWIAILKVYELYEQFDDSGMCQDFLDKHISLEDVLTASIDEYITRLAETINKV